jgi:hypothetical protein
MILSSEMACINSPYSIFHFIPRVYLVSIIAANRKEWRLAMGFDFFTVVAKRYGVSTPLPVKISESEAKKLSGSIGPSPFLKYKKFYIL